MESTHTDDQLRDPVELARIRTALALDRTLLSWIRTAMTLIGFGFTLAKFVHDMISKGYLHGVQPWYPRQIGFLLIGLGVFTLIGGAFEYVRMGKKLTTTTVFWSISLMLAVSLGAIGVFLIISLVGEL